MSEPETANEHNDRWDGERSEKPPYQILLFGAGIILFVLVLGLILDWYINPHTSAQRKDLAQALGLITAGVAGAVGIFFTWQGQRITQRNQESNQRNTQQQIEQSRNELDIIRQGQLTERFTKAIEQLGSENLELRLGGIYSLERTAHEGKDYHWPIMEVLTSYIRRHAARKPEQESGKNASPEPDILAIMDVITRRSEQHIADEKAEHKHIILNDTDLREASFDGADLSGASFDGADLRGANLQVANLRDASFNRADLSGALLNGADLRGAELQRAYLHEAMITGADLSGADLSGASFYRANLSGSKLKVGFLLDGVLRIGNLDADFRGANLTGADLTEADLTEGWFLQIGNSERVQGRSFTQKQLEETRGNDETRLPSHLKPPAHWDVKTDEQNEGN